MQFDYKAFRVDATPRRADGEYMAHATISRRLSDGDESSDSHASGDLAGFHSRDDAIEHAKRWAVDWIDNNWV